MPSLPAPLRKQLETAIGNARFGPVPDVCHQIQAIDVHQADSWRLRLSCQTSPQAIALAALPLRADRALEGSTHRITLMKQRVLFVGGKLKAPRNPNPWIEQIPTRILEELRGEPVVA